MITPNMNPLSPTGRKALGTIRNSTIVPSRHKTHISAEADLYRRKNHSDLPYTPSTRDRRRRATRAGCVRQVAVVLPAVQVGFCTYMGLVPGRDGCAVSYGSQGIPASRRQRVHVRRDHGTTGDQSRSDAPVSDEGGRGVGAESKHRFGGHGDGIERLHAIESGADVRDAKGPEGSRAQRHDWGKASADS